MNSERMLKEWRYLRGRKISKVRKYGAFVCLHFENGSFCILSGGASYGEDYITIEEDLGDFTHHDLLDMDIITEEECQARDDEQESRWKKEARDDRLKQYEQLKKEFEPE